MDAAAVSCHLDGEAIAWPAADLKWPEVGSLEDREAVDVEDEVACLHAGLFCPASRRHFGDTQPGEGFGEEHAEIAMPAREEPLRSHAGLQVEHEITERSEPAVPVPLELILPAVAAATRRTGEVEAQTSSSLPRVAGSG